MKRVGAFLFGATFGTLVGLIVGIAGSVGLGIIFMEQSNPPRRYYPDYSDKYKGDRNAKSY